MYGTSPGVKKVCLKMIENNVVMVGLPIASMPQVPLKHVESVQPLRICHSIYILQLWDTSEKPFSQQVDCKLAEH